MKKTQCVTALVASVIMLAAGHASTASAQETADTLLFDNGRLAIVLDDEAVALRDGTGERRVFRIERPRDRRAIRMMRFDGEEGDTLTFNFEDLDHLLERSERFARNFEGRFENWHRSNLREFAQMERQARELAMQLRRADEQDRQRLERELRDHLDQLFDAKLEAEQQRLEEREERLERERLRLEERLQRRNEIIERRYRELMGEQDVLDW